MGGEWHLLLKIIISKKNKKNKTYLNFCKSTPDGDVKPEIIAPCNTSHISRQQHHPVQTYGLYGDVYAICNVTVYYNLVIEKLLWYYYQ